MNTDLLGNGAGGNGIGNLAGAFDSLAGLLGAVGGGGGSSSSSAANTTVSVNPNIFAQTGGAGGNPAAGGGAGGSASSSAATSQTPAGQFVSPGRYDIDDPPTGTNLGASAGGGGLDDGIIWIMVGVVALLFIMDKK